MEHHTVENDEVLVLVQFSGVGIDEVIHSDPAPSFKIIGLQENDPVIQIGPQFYSGRLENAPGTNLFFKMAAFNQEAEYTDLDKDLQGIPDMWAEYIGKSCKVLNVKRVYPKEKADVLSADKGSAEIEMQETILGE